VIFVIILEGDAVATCTYLFSFLVQVNYCYYILPLLTSVVWFI